MHETSPVLAKTKLTEVCGTGGNRFARRLTYIRTRDAKAKENRRIAT